MANEFKGSSAHAAQHQHGVQHRVEPEAPKPVTEGRIANIEEAFAALEERVAKLEAASAHVED